MKHVLFEFLFHQKVPCRQPERFCLSPLLVREQKTGASIMTFQNDFRIGAIIALQHRRSGAHFILLSLSEQHVWN